MTSTIEKRNWHIAALVGVVASIALCWLVARLWPQEPGLAAVVALIVPFYAAIALDRYVDVTRTRSVRMQAPGSVPQKTLEPARRTSLEAVHAARNTEAPSRPASRPPVRLPPRSPDSRPSWA